MTKFRTQEIKGYLVNCFARQVLLTTAFCLSLVMPSFAQETKTAESNQTASQLAAMALTIGEMKQTIEQQNLTIQALSEAKSPESEAFDRLLGFKYRPRLRTVFFTFSNDTKPTLIPGSERAAFCALTFVNDLTETGSCKVFIENSAWHVQSGEGFEGNNCAAACLFLD